MTSSLFKTLKVFRADIGAYFLAAIVGSNILLLGATAPNWAFAQGNNWYVGKGAKPNTYYTYEIQNFDTNEGRPFLMTIYLKNYDSANQYWVAPVYVVDQGKVFNGTLHLSGLDMSALGSSEIPPEMNKYRAAYSNSLQWLAAYVPKPGQSLSAPNWGKIAAIGGSAISPGGSAKVTTPAGTFDTTDVSWRYGPTNHIYVNPNLPYPVKAKTFAAVTTGNPPVQYAFELQSSGAGEPAPPKSVQELPKSPLTQQTGRATYSIQLLWEPDPIVAGKETTIGLIFSNSFGATITQVTYDLSITSENGTKVTEMKDQRADEGTAMQKVIFPFPGPNDAKVTITSVEGVPTGEFVESATFTVVAT
jgi:hypothetical protein